MPFFTPTNIPSVTTMALSEEGFGKLKAQIEDFRDKILVISKEDTEQERIYQCNINFFPVTEKTKKDGAQ